MSRRLPLCATACVAVLLAACGSSQSTSTTTSASPTGSASASATATNQHIFEADHFAPDAIVGAVVNEDCTLSGGTKTTCA
ncbi:MAG: plastocyanin, partial [Actinobacteria bacterium]|nr:plastocyanin [Actinomycetota bacterium]